MEKKLDEIFTFLKDNRKYNQLLQDRFYLSVISPYKTTSEKVISLLYHIASTQNKPKIDSLATFYKKIIQDIDSTSSMKKFIEKTTNSREPLKVNFGELYKGMRDQDGWGKKTSALFTKVIFHLHNGKYSKELKFWDDVPKSISNDKNEHFYLPVDSVITAIFKKLDESKTWDFDSINSKLKENYQNYQIEVWDDLWFWGFITQKGSGNNRVFTWNENKYWSLKDSDKSAETINQIKNKSETFLKLF